MSEKGTEKRHLGHNSEPVEPRVKKAREIEEGQVSDDDCEAVIDDFMARHENVVSADNAEVQNSGVPWRSEDELDHVAMDIKKQFDLEDETGPNLVDGVTDMVTKLMKKSMSDVVMKTKLEIIRKPSNCDVLGSPKLDRLSLRCAAIITLRVRTPACAPKQGTLPHLLHLWTEIITYIYISIYTVFTTGGNS